METSERLLNLLDVTSKLPPDQRSPYLDAACAGDAELRAEVESLLRSHDDAGRFMASPTGELPSHPGPHGVPVGAPLREGPGSHIGPYKLLQLIGEGGFGSVFLAEQHEPVRRRVALKIIKPGMDTRAVIARFEAERQALAMMDHPNIARVLDAGATETGRPYFVMEYIKGVRILEYCDDARLDTRARLELFGHVCHAIQHAHQKGIIHRDIKPSNVLVTMHDGVPVPKVIDFGIAKATSSELTQKTLFTEHRQMIGTPAYMSPEQAEMSGLDIDTRTDIYSLGVLLYELLTGTTPFAHEELMRKGFAEMMRMIREVEPHKPSTRLSSLGVTGTRTAQQRLAGDAKKLSSILKGDLDWIVMKCLEKDRTRRYETAHGLATDINRHLNDEPVTAGPPGTGYRLRKFVKRNRARVIAAGAIAAVLMLGVVGTSAGMLWALREKAKASQAALSEAAAKVAAQENERKAIDAAKSAEASKEEEASARRRAETISAFVTTALQASDAQNAEFVPGGVGGAHDVTILAAMDNAVKDIDSGRFHDDPETEAALRGTIGVILRNNGKYDEAGPLLEQALAMHERLYGPDDPIVAACLDHLAQLYYQLGQYDRAEPLFLRALAILENALGPDHPDVATSLNDLAVLYCAKGQYALAEPPYMRALAIREKALGPDHPDVANGLSNLAVLYRALGQHDRAEALHMRALAIREKALGPEHPDVANTLYNLGSIYLDRGRYDQAEPLFTRALAIYEKALGPDHPMVATCLKNVGTFSQERAEYSNAEMLFTRALAIEEKAYGPEHVNVANTLEYLASLAHARGEYALAEEHFARAIAITEKALGPDHPALAFQFKGLANLYVAQAQYARAEPLFTRAMAIFERALGPDHPNLAQCLSGLARAQQALGKTAEARQSFDRAVELLRPLSPEGSPLLARVLWRSGVARLENKDAPAALPELEEAVAIAERLLTPDHSQLAEYRQTLAQCRAALADQEPPEPKPAEE